MPTLPVDPNFLPMRLTLRKRVRRNIFSILLDKLIIQNSKGKTIADSIRFVLDQASVTPKIPFFHSREKLWAVVASGHLKQEWVGIEFGVASGDATKFIAKLPEFQTCTAWHGFDTFLGLPTPWGDLPQGAFSTGGVPPQINDTRFVWHVGDIAETISELGGFDISRIRKFIIFDFDLYTPTRIAWDKLVRLLQPGDVIYFDEAYEADESRIISEIFNSSEIKMIPIGFTIMASCYLVGESSPA